ncbi:PorP/SprF family type IX secretion system membrane protein [Gaetbulibacter sp. M240]|uniref:PorP/SprF family type IX secretion system membrane protein n=1 Tax=Gaetbulibacter sp. M240 TaxID=3126511 RepID=UPI00374FC9F5
MKKFALYIILCLFGLQELQAQNDGVAPFSIPVRNSLRFNKYAMNPTFSFVREQNKYLTFTNKREWVQFDNPPQTYLFSFSGRFSENVGAGLGLFQQDYGVLTTFGGIVNFAYNAMFDSENNLTFGLNVGFYSSSINEGAVITNFPDPSFNNIQSNSVLTINPGINYGTGFMDFGVSINNLVSYNISASEMIEDNPEQGLQAHMMYTGYFNTRGFFDESKFQMLVRSEFKKDQTVLSGVAMVLVPRGIWAQAGYNTLYGVSGGLGLNLTNNIAIEYNYEKAIGDLNSFGNSHEITLAYRFNNNNRYRYSGDDEEEALIQPSRKPKRPVRKPQVNRPVDQPVVKQPKEEPIVTPVEEEKPEPVVENTQEEDNAAAEAEAKRAAEERAAQEAEASRLKSEAEAKAKAEAEARARAFRIAQEKAAQEAKAKAEAEAKAQAEAQAKRIAQEKAKAEAEAKVKAEAEAQAKRVAEEKAAQEAATKAKAEEEAEAQAKLIAEEKARAEAENEAKLVAEEKARQDARARLKIEADAIIAQQELEAVEIPVAKDQKAKVIESLTELTVNTSVEQQNLLDELNAKVAGKQKDLEELKRENDLSEQGIYTEPKPFKSVTAENAAIESLKNQLNEVIKSQDEQIAKLENAYEDRKKNFSNDDDPVNVYYSRKLKDLRSQQFKAVRSRDNLIDKLENIKEATEVERKRRIKRAAYDNQEDRYKKDRTALENIKRTTALNSASLTVNDFDFGEEQTTNVQIVKGVQFTDPGFYTVLAVHSNEAKRDEFVKKAIASGLNEVDFFYDVNTNKYYIYSKKFNDVNAALRAVDTKTDDPYNSKMTIVSIEK